jgi:hypothetical protein
MPLFRRFRPNVILPPLQPWANFYTGGVGVADEQRLFHLQDFLSFVTRLSMGTGGPGGPGPNISDESGRVTNFQAVEVSSSFASFLNVLPINNLENNTGSPIVNANSAVTNIVPGTYNLAIDPAGGILLDPPTGLPLVGAYDFTTHLLYFCYLFSKYLFSSQLMRLNGEIWDRSAWIWNSTNNGDVSFTTVKWGGYGYGNANLVVKVFNSTLPDPPLAPPGILWSNQPDILQVILSLYRQLNITVPPINTKGYTNVRQDYQQIINANKDRIKFNNIFFPPRDPGKLSDDGILGRIRANGNLKSLSRRKTGRVFVGFNTMLNNLGNRETLNFANEILGVLIARGIYPNLQLLPNFTSLTTLTVGTGSGNSSMFNTFNSITGLFNGYQLWSLPDSITSYPIKRRSLRTYRLIASTRLRTLASNIFFRSTGFDMHVLGLNGWPANGSDPPEGISWILVIFNNCAVGFGTFSGEVYANTPANCAPIILPSPLALPIYSSAVGRTRSLLLRQTLSTAVPGTNIFNINRGALGGGPVIATYDSINGVLNIITPPNQVNNIEVYFGNNIRAKKKRLGDKEERTLMVGFY